jgi:hypothetical protein
MVIELDRSTAALPWELLDTDAGKKGWGARSALPWALNSKLIRKLRVERFRRDVVDATQEDNILVIGEPRCDANQYPPLPGARREAHAVSKVALAVSGGMPGERVVTLADNNDAQTIINALFARNYRIVHIAGHGKGGKHGGVVLSGVNTVLGSDEIRALRVVPELVFLNCCHLAKDNGISPLAQYDRAAFAASIAEELIRSGVRCVIAAGWAVEDVAAERFATTFYNTLFRGARFIDAVGKARYAAWEANRKGNTWAAYQCYGDPEWSWRRNTDAPPVAPAEEIGGISSAVNLILVLEGLATEADHAPSAELQRHAVRLDYLATSFGDRWGEQGEVADAFAKAYVAVQDRPRALQWFEKARAASDGGASLMTIELYAAQLCLPNSPPSDIRKAIGIVEKLLAVGET